MPAVSNTPSVTDSSCLGATCALVAVHGKVLLLLPSETVSSPAMRSPSTLAVEVVVPGARADQAGDHDLDLARRAAGCCAPAGPCPARATSMSSSWNFCLTAKLPARRRAPGMLAGPGAARVGRHDPQLDARHAADADRLLRRAHLQALVGRPVADAAVVRHDARAGLELEQLRQQLGVELGQQVERDHASRLDRSVSKRSRTSKRARSPTPALLRVLGRVLHQAAGRGRRQGRARRASPPRSRCARRPSRGR